MSDPLISGQWLQQLNAELSGSDRACAVLAGAVLDDRLMQLLERFLLPPIKKSEDRLLGRGGALDSFSARIELARRLNLVANEISKSLDWVREIRNDAAHREQFSFQDSKNRDRVDNIIGALELTARGPGLLVGRYASPKGHFIACTAMLVARLHIETTSVKGPLHEPISNAQFSIGA
jgi:hypothetical protein